MSLHAELYEQAGILRGDNTKDTRPQILAVGYFWEEEVLYRLIPQKLLITKCSEPALASPIYCQMYNLLVASRTRQLAHKIEDDKRVDLQRRRQSAADEGMFLLAFLNQYSSSLARWIFFKLHFITHTLQYFYVINEGLHSTTS